MLGSFSHPSIYTNFITTLFHHLSITLLCTLSPTHSTTHSHYFHPTFPRLSANPTRSSLWHTLQPQFLTPLRYCLIFCLPTTQYLYSWFILPFCSHSLTSLSTSHILSLTIRKPLSPLSSPLYPHSLSNSNSIPKLTPFLSPLSHHSSTLTLSHRSLSPLSLLILTPSRHSQNSLPTTTLSLSSHFSPLSPSLSLPTQHPRAPTSSLSPLSHPFSPTLTPLS